MSLIDVCYEQMKDNFWHGLFGDFKLIIDKNTGYFNGTKLCKDGGKRFRDWKQTERSKKLIQYYETQPRNNVSGSGNCIYEVRLQNNDELNKQITGQYLPQEFLQSIIAWIKLPKISSKEGVVYVVTTSTLKFNNIYKIGYSKNFQDRLDTFNAYRHSSEPQFYAVAIYSTNNAKKLETLIHKKLKEFRSEGEFFQCEFKVIQEQFLDQEDCELIENDYEEDHDNVFQKMCDSLEELDEFKQLFI